MNLTLALSSCLLACAVTMWLLPEPCARRLPRRVPEVALTTERTGTHGRAQRVVFAVCGVVAGYLFGGVMGLLAGVLLGLGVPVLTARADRRQRAGQEHDAAAVPLALDLVGACLAGGSGLAQAMTAVAGAMEGGCQERFRRVAAALQVGSAPAEAFRELGADGVAGAAARALSRAAEGGAPVADLVSQVADDARRQAAALSLRRAKRAGVAAAGPLGAFFLPAFMLLGVAPTVGGMVGPLLAQVS